VPSGLIPMIGRKLISHNINELYQKENEVVQEICVETKKLLQKGEFLFRKEFYQKN
jgi:hypothetical protein